AIKGYKNTAAEKYAKDNELEFIPLDEDKNDDSTTSKTDSTESKNDGKPDDTSKPDDTQTTDQDTTSGEDESFLKGDVNGDGYINVTDIALVASHIKGIKPLSDKGLKAADVNEDTKVNVTDIALIAAHIKGIKAIV
ncbi:MAG: dockerin type I repeat-containing protein, partial [Ruminococcus sp.]|nr:dockerin type I repeat-containing protein [Ruminococcus sp.]